MAVLVACATTILIVGVLEVLVLAPRTVSVEFELIDRPRPGITPDGAEEVVRRIEERELAPTVGARQRRGGQVVTLSGLESIEAVAPVELEVNEVLIESGYHPSPGETRPVVDGEAMITRHPILVLGSQAVVLILFGGVFARLRVRRVAVGQSSSATSAIAIGLAAGGAAFVCAVLVSVVQALLGWSVEEQAWLLELLKDRDSLLSLIPLVVLVVPLAEEVFFRGYFFRFLLQRSGPVWAYLLSAACFSLVHLHLPGLVTYFVVGLLFAWVCSRTSTLLAPVIGHATYNGLALGVSLLTGGL
jgi:membrane protease YdiL (CAAX protease family)